MKSTLKNAVAGVLARSGVVRAVARRRLPDRVAILMYHGVTAAPLPVRDWCFIESAAFRRQLEYLARNCCVLPLAEAAALLQTNGVAARTGGRPAVVITFDDGYRNNHDVAAPLLREFGLPATIFLNTALIDSDATLWFCQLHAALSQTTRPAVTWQGTRWPLTSPSERAAASAGLQAALKARPHAQLLAGLGTLLEQLGERAPAGVATDSPYAFMTSAQVRALAAEGLIDFGAHTHEHTILARLPLDEQRAQIETSIEHVAQWTGRPCTLFAYPNGQAQDYTAETTALLRAAGIRAAVTTIEQPAAPGDDPLQLGRYGIGEGLGQAMFEITIHHGLTLARGGKP